ncbi:MAG: MYG1 family protein [Verrucomicrobia bacterium]|nr:MYG1 family protein [Verrucomicrobiota bacterium]MDA1065081.1 MYG1 family protein [Verrucomicrobiota bacterium]
MNSVKLIVTHPGGAHKDDFLACSVLAATYGVPIERRDPTEAELADPAVCVVDVGHEHDPEKRNFDHHQFPRDHVPTCALSLVFQYLELYEDAQEFYDWLEPAEWFDCRGANDTAKFLGVERDIINKLNSPIDGTLIRRFALNQRIEPGQPLWEMMKLVGSDMVDFLKTLRSRIEFVGEHAELWEIDHANGNFKVVFLPRTEPLPEEPSMGIIRYTEEQGLDKEVVGLVYPDRRGQGYGLSRYKDHPSLEFTKIEAEADVHFAHKKGFVAKSSATEIDRLKELLQMAWHEE